ncbi:MAG: hypothetical protein AAF471_02090 [Myxococcota bacterium]
MADHVNLARLSHVAPPHAWRGKTQLKQADFVFKQDKILCAAPNAAGTFWAPGAADEAFHARLDGRDRVIERTWTPVTKQEHDRLRQAIEPRTGEPHVLFAWMPLPPQREELPPAPAASSSDSKVELATDLDIVDKTDENDDDDETPNVESDKPKKEKKEAKRTSKAKGKNKDETGADDETEQ